MAEKTKIGLQFVLDKGLVGTDIQSRITNAIAYGNKVFENNGLDIAIVAGCAGVLYKKEGVEDSWGEWSSFD